MFTGIVEEIGYIGKIVRGQSSIRLVIECSTVLGDIKIGDSIAVNGICLTVAERGDDYFLADVMPETIRKTALDTLNVSDLVNLERALQVSERLGGHIVSGHIDGTGTVRGHFEEDNAIWLMIEASPDILKYIVAKGSVTLDGVSLTVADISPRRFKVSLIPHTASLTILGRKKIGDAINIECDIIGKYIEKLVFNRNESDGKTDISVDFLKEHGFV